MNFDRTIRARFAPGRLGVATALLLGATLLFQPMSNAVAYDIPATVGLGEASGYTVVAGTTVTNTGDTVVSNGDLGVSPGDSVTGFPPGIVTAPGTIHINDGPAADASNAVMAAYTDAQNRAADEDLGLIFDLGGQTYTTGVYAGASSLAITGTVTLDAENNPDAVFIFQAGSTLTTATGSSVQLINGAQACNVFWQVGSSATLGGGSTFQGTILALASISLDDAVNVQGRLFAGAAVTLINDQISAPGCAPSSGVAQAPLLGRLGLPVLGAALVAAAGVVVVRRRTSLLAR